MERQVAVLFETNNSGTHADTAVDDQKLEHLENVPEVVSAA
jgi:hypothetical protein